MSDIIEFKWIISSLSETHKWTSWRQRPLRPRQQPRLQWQPPWPRLPRRPRRHHQGWMIQSNMWYTKIKFGNQITQYGSLDYDSYKKRPTLKCNVSMPSTFTLSIVWVCGCYGALCNIRCPWDSCLAMKGNNYSCSPRSLRVNHLLSQERLPRPCQLLSQNPWPRLLRLPRRPA